MNRMFEDCDSSVTMFAFGNILSTTTTTTTTLCNFHPRSVVCVLVVPG